MTRSKIDPPTDGSTPIATALQEEPPLIDSLEPRPGEEIVRIEDHGAYTSVVAEPSGAAGNDRGRFTYRVQWEPRTDGEGGQYQWRDLGRADGDGGE